MVLLRGTEWDEEEFQVSLGRLRRWSLSAAGEGRVRYREFRTTQLFF